MKKTTILVLLAFVTGCSAGPFVTDVAPRADGGLDVRSCKARVVLDIVSTGPCMVYTVPAGARLGEKYAGTQSKRTRESMFGTRQPGEPNPAP